MTERGAPPHPHHHRTHHRHPHAAGAEGTGIGPAEAQAASALVTDVADASLSLAERKAQLIERIERQRLLRQTRRIQAAIAKLQATGQGAHAEGDTGFPRSKTLRAITGQPLLAAGAVGVVLMLGPKRLVRLASWVLPMLLRRR